MREQFERLPEIAEILNNYSIKFMNHSGWYESKEFKDFGHEQFVNGAWYTYQEQQKKLESIASLIDSLISNSEHFGFDSEQEETGLLSVVYMNGQFHKLTNIFEIRDKIWK